MSVEKFKKKLKIGNTTLLMNVLSQSLSLSFSLKFLEGARPGQMYLSDPPAPLHIIETITWENGPNAPPPESLPGDGIYTRHIHRKIFVFTKWI